MAPPEKEPVMTTNRYRALSPVGEATYGAGEVDLTLSTAEEADAIGNGHLALVPRTYRALSDNYGAAKQGDTFQAAYLVENEAALIQGGHIERVDAPAPEKASSVDEAKPKAADKKASAS